MEDRFDKLDNKIDKLGERLDSIDRTLAKQEAHLEYHIKRTEQNEEMICQLNKKIYPIEESILQFRGAGKLVSWIALILGIIATMLKLMKFF